MELHQKVRDMNHSRVVETRTRAHRDACAAGCRLYSASSVAGNHRALTGKDNNNLISWLTRKNFHTDSTEVVQCAKQDLFKKVRERSPALVTAAQVSKGGKTQENGGSGVFIY